MERKGFKGAVALFKGVDWSYSLTKKVDYNLRTLGEDYPIEDLTVKEIITQLVEDCSHYDEFYAMELVELLLATNESQLEDFKSTLTQVMDTRRKELGEVPYTEDELPCDQSIDDMYERFNRQFISVGESVVKKFTQKCGIGNDVIYIETYERRDEFCTFITEDLDLHIFVYLDRSIALTCDVNSIDYGVTHECTWERISDWDPNSLIRIPESIWSKWNTSDMTKLSSQLNKLNN